MHTSPTNHGLLESLTAAQRDAVQHIDGPLMVLAGPGSGKTRVVTHRIANLLQHGIAARQILALTFTNKAAEEMRSRLNRLAPGEAVWMGTFHRFCARMLRQYASLVGLEENFTIYDAGDSLNVVKRTIEEDEIHLTRTSPERVARGISRAKNDLTLPEDFTPRPGHPADRIVAEVYPAYQQRLLSSNAVDFDDLLLHAACLLRENQELRHSLDERYRYILVDEYQDTNLAQYTMIRALSVDHPNISVTGDPDQSIYSWRGADLNNILQFESDFPGTHVVRLEQNYRSSQRILRVADRLITHNTRRKVKVLFTDNDEGEAVRVVAYADERDEAAGIAKKISQAIQSGRRRPRDFAIFYRINALSRVFEQALYEQGVPYQIVNGFEFYQRREIKDILAYLHLINNVRNDLAMERVINRPPRGIGRVTLQRMSHHAARNGLSLLEAARQPQLLETLARKPAKAVKEFVQLIDSFKDHMQGSVEEILGHVISQSGYAEHLRESAAPEDQDRLDNIHELLSAARQFDEDHFEDGGLDAFLEQVSLVSDTDAFEVEPDQVTLMTLHAAKGLEFPAVFIVAVEEKLLPHERSLRELDSLEEERRLLFVGITRACESLELSISRYRDFRGTRRRAIPSSFLMEIPRNELEVTRLEDSSVVDTDISPEYGSQRTPATGNNSSRSRPEIPAAVVNGLVTAAELADATDSGSPRIRTDPNEFHIGMVVRHPEYELGKVIALSGGGDRRTATVQFFGRAGERKIRLVHSDLRPVKNPR